MPSPYFDGLGDKCLDIFKDEVKASFRSQTGVIQSIEIIFNDRHQETDMDGRAYGAPKPMAWFKTGLICPVYGDLLYVNDAKYIIREVKDDGLELTELTLSDAVG